MSYHDIVGLVAEYLKYLHGILVTYLILTLFHDFTKSTNLLR